MNTEFKMQPGLLFFYFGLIRSLSIRVGEKSFGFNIMDFFFSYFNQTFAINTYISIPDTNY